MVDTFNKLKILLNSLVERPYHDRSLLIPLDRCDESLNFVHPTVNLEDISDKVIVRSSLIILYENLIVFYDIKLLK